MMYRMTLRDEADAEPVIEASFSNGVKWMEMVPGTETYITGLLLMRQATTRKLRTGE